MEFHVECCVWENFQLLHKFDLFSKMLPNCFKNFQNMKNSRYPSPNHHHQNISKLFTYTSAILQAVYMKVYTDYGICLYLANSKAPVPQFCQKLHMQSKWHVQPNEAEDWHLKLLYFNLLKALSEIVKFTPFVRLLLEPWKAESISNFHVHTQ